MQGRNSEVIEEVPPSERPIGEALESSAPQPELEAERPTSIRIRAMAWLASASGLAYFARNSLSVSESRIREDLGLTLSQSGYFMGAFFWTYALLQVPAGAFSHRYGTRIAMSLFVVTWSVALFLTAISPVFWLLVAAQLLMGMAQAGFFPAATNSVRFWMPISRRSLAGAMLNGGMQIGAILSSILTGTLLAYMTWRWVFVLYSIPGLIWAVVYFRRYRDKPELCSKVNDAERQLIVAGRPIQQKVEAGEETAATDWGAMLRHRTLWLLFGQQICRASGYMFYASWFPTFLQKTRGVSIAQSGYMQGMIFAASLFGSLMGGMLIDWIWKRSGNLRFSRSGVGTASLAISGLMILSSWFVSDARFAMGLLVMGSLCGSVAGPAMMASVIDISGSRVAHVLGAVNMAGNFAVALCPILIGKLFEATEDWNLVLLVFAGIYLTGAACFAFVNPQIGIFRPTPPRDAQ